MPRLPDEAPAAPLGAPPLAAPAAAGGDFGIGAAPVGS